MIYTKELEYIITKCGIIKETVPLPDKILGHYHYDGKSYYILINESIDNEKLYRSVLAEEIGHYRTTIGDITPRKYMCYADRLTIDKMELRALKWATDYLIPDNSIIDYIKEISKISFDELVEYFCVTKEFLMSKFEFMSYKNHMWELDKDKYLCLYKLPSVFIYKNFFKR